MGLDFVCKTSKSFFKALDARRVELATPDLFSTQPSSQPRSYAADICEGKAIEVGDSLGIHLQENQVRALRGLECVAIIRNPPEELLQALSLSFGEASAIVLENYHIANVAELTIR